MQKISKNLRLRLVYGAVILFGILLDQVTKALAVKYLSPRATLPLWKNVFHFTYVENRGAAFGMLKDHRWVFLVFSTVAILALCVYLFRGISYMSDKREDGSYPALAPLGGVSLAMIISGGVGNMIDRLCLGYVVDFIDVRLINFAVFYIHARNFAVKKELNTVFSRVFCVCGNENKLIHLIVSRTVNTAENFGVKSRFQIKNVLSG